MKKRLLPSKRRNVYKPLYENHQGSKAPKTRLSRTELWTTDVHFFRWRTALIRRMAVRTHQRDELQLASPAEVEDADGTLAYILPDSAYAHFAG